MLLEKSPKPAHLKFANEYYLDLNGTKAYMRTYPNSSRKAASVSAHHLMKHPTVKKLLAELKKDRTEYYKGLEEEFRRRSMSAIQKHLKAFNR